MGRQAFSLVEVLVVLAIIAILIGLGTTGLVQFRATNEIREASNQLVSNLNTIKNAAKNDVRPSNTNFKGYRFTFLDQAQVLHYCLEIRDSNDNITTEWSCRYSADIQSSLINTVYPVYYGSKESSSSMAVCRTIYFESLTGDILVASTDNVIKNNLKCYVPIKDGGNNQKRYLYVDSLSDSYYIVSSLSQLDLFN